MEARVLIRTASGSMHHYRPFTSSYDHDSLFFGSVRNPRSTITLHIDRRSSSSPPESCHSAPLRRTRSDACAAVRSAKWSESTEITTEDDKEDLLVLDSGSCSKRFFLETATSDKTRGAVVEEEVESSGSAGSGRGRKIGGGGRGNGNSSDGGSAGERSGEMGAYYKEMLRADPGNPLLLRNYGKFLQEVEGDVEGAEECYGRAILACPGDGEVLSLYGNLMWEAHRDEKRAEDYHQRAVEASPDDSYVLGSYAHFLWDAEEEMSAATASLPSRSSSSSNGAMVEAF